MFLYKLFSKKDVIKKISESKLRILKYDSDYAFDMKCLEAFIEDYEGLELTKEQRLFLNDYIALLETINEHNGTVCYFAGFFDALKIVKKNRK